MKKAEVNTDRLGNKKGIVIMENCLFTNIVESDFRKTPILKWVDLLDFVAVEHNLKCRFSEFGMFGNINEINKAYEIVINSIKNN